MRRVREESIRNLALGPINTSVTSVQLLINKIGEAGANLLYPYKRLQLLLLLLLYRKSTVLLIATILDDVVASDHIIFPYSRVHCDTDQAPVVEPRDGGTTPPSVEIKNDEPDEDEEEHGR